MSVTHSLMTGGFRQTIMQENLKSRDRGVCSDGKFGSFQRAGSFGSAPKEEPALSTPERLLI